MVDVDVSNRLFEILWCSFVTVSSPTRVEIVVFSDHLRIEFQGLIRTMISRFVKFISGCIFDANPVLENGSIKAPERRSSYPIILIHKSEIVLMLPQKMWFDAQKLIGWTCIEAPGDSRGAALLWHIQR